MKVRFYCWNLTVTLLLSSNFCINAWLKKIKSWWSRGRATWLFQHLSKSEQTCLHNAAQGVYLRNWLFKHCKPHTKSFHPTLFSKVLPVTCTFAYSPNMLCTWVMHICLVLITGGNSFKFFGCTMSTHGSLNAVKLLNWSYVKKKKIKGNNSNALG